jgi:CubicO group peptidase (beta-lactamase class C family)
VSPKLVRTSFAYLPLSFAPSGTTLMMSAEALMSFASAHMRDGIGVNGVRILSTQAAQAMRRSTVDNQGKGYPYTDGMGLGWMISQDGLLHHAGGGPGIFSVLYLHPSRQWAAAIMTNAEHGLSLINEWMGPWLSELGTIQPFGMIDIRMPSETVRIDADRYVGLYQDIANRYRISRTPDGLTLSKQTRFAYYENISTEPTPYSRLIPLGEDRFLLDAETTEGNESFDAFRVFTFRGEDAEGHKQYLGNSMRLYRRAA